MEALAPTYALALPVAFILSCYGMWWFYGNQGVCVMCQGRGKHKEGCPRDAD